MTSVDAEDERSESDGMSGAMRRRRSRVTRRGTVVKLEQMVEMKGVTFSDGDVKAGDGQSRSQRGAGGRTDRTEGGGEAHVAEWHRVGAKRVLGDVGRGEGS